MSSKNAGPPSGYTAPGQGTPGAYQQAATATAQGNRPTQNTPWGSMTWTQGPDGQWTQNLDPNGPMGQSIFNLQQQGANGTAAPISNGSDARTAAYNALYGQASKRLDTQFQQSGDNLTTQLANQGLQPGTSAYDNAMKNYNNAKTDAYQTAQNNAQVMAGNAAQQEQQMDVTSQQAPFQTQQLIQALMGMPGFSAGPNYLGAAEATGAYNLQNQQLQNSAMGGLFSGLGNMGGQLGSAALQNGGFGNMFSQLFNFGGAGGAGGIADGTIGTSLIDSAPEWGPAAAAVIV